VNERPLKDLCALLAIRIQQPTAVRDGPESWMGDGRIFLITSAPLSLSLSYRKNLISAGSILLDSTFTSLTLVSISCFYAVFAWTRELL
jgi:hypothetical protein